MPLQISAGAARLSRLRVPGLRRARSPALALIVMAAVATGCADPEAPVDTVRSRPVKLFTVDTGMGEEVRRFPARIEAAKQAALAFRVAGQLAELPVKEGDTVDEGQVVARLDATDFRIAVEDRQASFDNAQRNFARAKELIDDGNISQRDYDRMEAQFRSSRAALAQAQANLGYATLRAPFGGRIARREVDNFEEVQAKQTIVYLQDTDMLNVIIGMPESVVRSVTANTEDEIANTSVEESAAAAVRAMASFEDYPDISYALEIKEIASRADPDTQTFRITFGMPQPSDFTVLPGMTAQVEVDFAGLLRKSSATWVPARAVQADAELAPRVFVLDSDSMQVNSRAVTTGRLSGDMIEVLSGLSGGEEIVAVGAAYLADGMRVTRMRSGEQAVPREDDSRTNNAVGSSL